MARKKQNDYLEGRLYGYEFDREFSPDITVCIETDEKVLVPDYTVKNIMTKHEQVLVANRNRATEFREIVDRLGKWDFFYRFRKGVEVRNVVRKLTYTFPHNSKRYDKLLRRLHEFSISDDSKKRIRIRDPWSDRAGEIEVLG